jgi:ParB family chromosome partitioning protein
MKLDASTTRLPIDQIAIGKRHRKDYGDIPALARWIAEVGDLIHPISVRPNGSLIAGERRIMACRRLGWTEVPVRVLDLENDDVRGEFIENVARKDFNLSELVDIGEEVERIERERAKARHARTAERRQGNPGARGTLRESCPQVMMAVAAIKPRLALG